MSQNKKINSVPCRKSSKLILDFLSVAAKQNAISRCRGFLYEPEVPKLLKNIDGAEF